MEVENELANLLIRKRLGVWICLNLVDLHLAYGKVSP